MNRRLRDFFPMQWKHLCLGLIFMMASSVMAQAFTQRSIQPDRDLGGLDREPKRIVDVTPVFPNSMIMDGVERGMVNVAFMLGEDGEPFDIVPLAASDDRLIRRVIEAIEQWRYEPPTVDGKPRMLRIKMSIRMQYRTTGVSFQTAMSFTEARMGLRGGDARRWEIPSWRDLDAMPEPVKYSQPLYPEELIDSGEEGEAVLDFYLTPEGRVAAADVHSASHPAFGLAAYRALLGWEFSPPMKDGVPTYVHLRLPMRFTPPEDDES